MRTTLKFLQDYANASDNLWLVRKLQMLEYEIEIELIEQSLRDVKNDKAI
tara:strand:- start:234 stop:383 length:150 start_codon:yes stop_codon:yes gene_type:complete